MSQGPVENKEPHPEDSNVERKAPRVERVSEDPVVVTERVVGAFGRNGCEEKDDKGLVLHGTVRVFRWGVLIVSGYCTHEVREG